MDFKRISINYICLPFFNYFKKCRLSCLFLIFTFLPVVIFSQFKLDSTKKVKYVAVPVVFKTPETGWAFGLSGSVSFKTMPKSDTLTRTSVVQLLTIFSERGQNVQAVDATIYFPKEKYILYLQTSHSYFPDNFWGIGQNTKNEYENKYAFEQFFVSPHLKRKVSKHLFVGAILDYQTVFNINSTPGGIFDSTNFIGKTKYHVAGLGASVSYDTRNGTFWPTRGLFLQSNFILYNNKLASTYSFNKWIVDLRYYKQLFKNHIVAFQLYNYITIGETPLRSMALLGGSNNLRGFYQGRYRDNSMYSAIAEYRAYLFWRISACAFFGIGDVYKNGSDINLNSLKHSFGGGLRISILKKEKLNLRLDYGYSDKYNQGFYFTVAECF